MEWKGLGWLINTGPSGLSSESLHTALNAVMSKEMKDGVCRVQEQMRGEDGLNTAVTLIERELLVAID